QGTARRAVEEVRGERLRPEGAGPHDLPLDDLSALVAAQREERDGPPELLALLPQAPAGRSAPGRDRPDERQRDRLLGDAVGLAGRPDSRPRRRAVVLPD